jgi:diguanylate cyclase (GGDEF)-like protein
VIARPVPSDRARAELIIARVRWGGVALGAVQAFITVNPRPIGGPWIVLATAVVMAIYNLPASFALRLRPRALAAVAMGALAGDFLVVSSWTYLTSNDIYSTSYATYALVAIEAAVLYQWRGALATLGGFLIAYAGFYVLRDAAFGFAPDAGSVSYRTGIILMTGLFTGGITSQSEKRRAAADDAAESARAQAARAEALARVAGRIAQTLKSEYVLETVMDSLSSLFPERWHGILLAAADGQLHLEHVRGEPRNLQLPFPASVLDSSLEGPAIIADLHDDPRLASWGVTVAPELLQFRSAVALPLRGADRLFGALVTLSRDVATFQPDELAFLETLAHQTATALENSRLYEEVETLSLTDVTTALFNRRAFDIRLLEELDRAKRYTTPLAVLMIDVDHFKRYNDEHGHLAGDHVLRRVGEVVRQSLRQSDVAFRFGGEEFAVIMPHATRDGALALAHRLVREMEAAAFPHEETQPGGSLTVSVGVATFPDQGQSGRELVEKADAALYRAKESGKNRAVLYESGTGGPAGAEKIT